MGIIAKPLSLLLSWLYGLIGSYGIAIIILTIIVKLCLYPVYAKQIKSTMKMSAFQPKIQEIQQKYAKDRELMNEKLNELYKSEGASMYSGCLPMIVQMIVIMGLFTLLRNPMNYLTSDMLFATHESFLWIKDLAQPDKWILPIAAAIATFFSYVMSQSVNTTGANAAQTAMMTKVMKYFFPLMILWMARSYPAGLALYWFGSQVIQIFYNMRFNSWKKKAQAEKEAKEGKKRKKKATA
jgi:YidC/Oxa1 family membrane protein insertase